jgi:hypothetical protein
LDSRHKETLAPEFAANFTLKTEWLDNKRIGGKVTPTIVVRRCSEQMLHSGSIAP